MPETGALDLMTIDLTGSFRPPTCWSCIQAQAKLKEAKQKTSERWYIVQTGGSDRRGRMSQPTYLRFFGALQLNYFF
jgi:hypothetical protein